MSNMVCDNGDETKFCMLLLLLRRLLIPNLITSNSISTIILPSPQSFSNPNLYRRLPTSHMDMNLFLPVQRRVSF